MSIFFILFFIYSKNVFVPTEAKVINLLNDTKLKIETTKQIKFAQNASELINREMNEIVSENVFKEILEEINGVNNSSYDENTKDINECTKYNQMKFRKCIIQKQSIYYWCDKTAKTFFYEMYHANSINEIELIRSGSLEMLQIGNEKLDVAITKLKKRISNLNKSSKHIKKQTIDEMSNLIDGENKEIKRFYDDSNKAITDITNLKMKIDNEIKITNKLITKIEEAKTSLDSKEYLSGNRKSFINLSNECKNYLMAHGIDIDIHVPLTLFKYFV